MEKYGLAVRIEVQDSSELLRAEDQAILLFQSVRELLINITKHAAPDSERTIVLVVARRFEQCSTGLGETEHVLLGHEDGERISNHRPSIDPEQCLGAQTKQATVRLRCQNGILRLEVLDQGCGFESLYAATSWLRMPPRRDSA
jgi:two-component sensor histidine kinase